MSYNYLILTIVGVNISLLENINSFENLLIF